MQLLLGRLGLRGVGPSPGGRRRWGWGRGRQDADADTGVEGTAVEGVVATHGLRRRGVRGWLPPATRVVVVVVVAALLRDDQSLHGARS